MQRRAVATRAMLAPVTMFAALALLVMGGCSQTGTQTAPPGTTGPASVPGPPGAGQAPSPKQIPALGVIGAPSAEPRGLRVESFAPPPDPSPLKLMGVKEGDVVVSCNGADAQIRDRFSQAVTALQERGEPITLEVVRDGERLTLKRTEKFPLPSGE